MKARVDGGNALRPGQQFKGFLAHGRLVSTGAHSAGPVLSIAAAPDSRRPGSLLRGLVQAVERHELALSEHRVHVRPRPAGPETTSPGLGHRGGPGGCQHGRVERAAAPGRRAGQHAAVSVHRGRG